MESYRILILNDLSWLNPEHSSGPQACVAASDSVVLCPTALPAGGKGYGSGVTRLGLEAVGLAHAHDPDPASEKLESTFQLLSDLGIGWFGAGHTLEEAQTPYRIQLPEAIGGGQIHLHGYLQPPAGPARDPGIFAEAESPGCAPLTVSAVAPARNSSTPHDSFHVGLPHWGATSDWHSREQFKLAHRFLNKDYDLVLGHGSPTVQEVHRQQQRWVVYGTGSLSNARRQQPKDEQGGLAFSLWTMLEVYRQNGRRHIRLRLYPLAAGSSGTDTVPGPVTYADFDRIVATLASRPLRPWRFDNPAQRTGTDEFGHHIALELGEWAEGARPSRLVGPLEGRDPGDWPLRSPGAGIEDRVLGMNKHLGAAMLALGAASAGSTTQWLTREAGVIDAGAMSMLVYRYRNHESSLGATIVLDKVLSAEILQAAGVPTPKTFLVRSADQAVRAAADIPGPVVVKPRYGVQSKGVSISLVEDQEIREAFRFARENGSQVLVQQHIESSEELRVMASAERVVAVNGRALPHVIADGVSTIKQLIDDKNLQRTLNPSLESRPIPIDALTHRQLQRSGFSLESVPGLGQRVTVRNVAGLSVGGDTVQLLEETQPRIKDAGVAAIAAIPGLGWGGVDVIIEEGTGNPYVIEINTQAAYGAALFPAYGRPLDVGNEAWNIRYAATTPGVNAEPELPKRRSSPFLLTGAPGDDQNESKVRFRALFSQSLEKQNYAIVRKNLRVLNVTTAGGHTVWVTRGGLTAADRSVVQRIFQRHQWVLQILKLRGVPQTRGRVIASVEQLRRFTGTRSQQVMLSPVSASWGGPDAHLLSAQDALAMTSLPGRMWVQSRSAGPRVHVLATQQKAWMVTAPGSQQPLENEDIVAASQMAVQAVRAVPELRWAGVDLVLRPRRIRESRPGGVLVEGMSIGPAYSAEDHVIAGDFDAFCRWIVEAEDARTDSGQL